MRAPAAQTIERAHLPWLPKAQVRGHPVQKLAVYLQLIRARRLVAKVFLDDARRYRNHVLTLPVFDQIQSLPQGNT